MKQGTERGRHPAPTFSVVLETHVHISHPSAISRPWLTLIVNHFRQIARSKRRPPMSLHAPTINAVHGRTRGYCMPNECHTHARQHTHQQVSFWYSFDQSRVKVTPYETCHVVT